MYVVVGQQYTVKLQIILRGASHNVNISFLWKQGLWI